MKTTIRNIILIFILGMAAPLLAQIFCKNSCEICKDNIYTVSTSTYKTETGYICQHCKAKIEANACNNFINKILTYNYADNLIVKFLLSVIALVAIGAVCYVFYPTIVSFIASISADTWVSVFLVAYMVAYVASYIIVYNAYVASMPSERDRFLGFFIKSLALLLLLGYLYKNRFARDIAIGTYAGHKLASTF